MNFDLIRPCPHCPFRTDNPGFLRRTGEIAFDLGRDRDFVCHQTTEYDPEAEDMEATADSQCCAGALIMLEHAGAPTQAMRIAERLGVYDAQRLDMTAPVFRSAAAFIRHHDQAALGETDVEPECCHVVSAGCLAPAGLLVGGLVLPAEAEGDVHECPGCGEPVCDECSNDDGVCFYCNGEEE